jgi:hypothetical protein
LRTLQSKVAAQMEEDVSQFCAIHFTLTESIGDKNKKLFIDVMDRVVCMLLSPILHVADFSGHEAVRAVVSDATKIRRVKRNLLGDNPKMPPRSDSEQIINLIERMKENLQRNNISIAFSVSILIAVFAWPAAVPYMSLASFTYSAKRYLDRQLSINTLERESSERMEVHENEYEQFIGKKGAAANSVELQKEVSPISTEPKKAFHSGKPKI